MTRLFRSYALPLAVSIGLSLLFRFRRYPRLFQWRYVARGTAGIAIRNQRGVVTVPDPTLPLVEAIRSFVETRGRRFILGYEDIDERLLSSLKGSGFMPVDLVTLKRYPRDGHIGLRKGIAKWRYGSYQW